MLQIASVGVVAGLASALLFAAPIGGTLLAFPLFALASLPIAIAGLGWGALAGAIALVVSSLAIGAAFSPLAAAVFFLLCGGPIFWLARLIVLSRPVDPTQPKGAHEWYPLSRILLQSSVVVAAGIVLVGFLIGFNPDAEAQEVATSLATWLASVPEIGPTPSAADLEPIVHLNMLILPYLMAAMALSLAIFNLWLGAAIAKASGRFARPKERLWTVTLPTGAALGFVAALAASIVPGPIGLAAAVLAGALGLAVAIVGLAVVHAVTLGTSTRSLVLALTYGVLLVFGFPIVLFALLGLGETFFHLRARRFHGAPPHD